MDRARYLPIAIAMMVTSCSVSVPQVSDSKDISSPRFAETVPFSPPNEALIIQAKVTETGLGSRFLTFSAGQDRDLATTDPLGTFELDFMKGHEFLTSLLFTPNFQSEDGEPTQAKIFAWAVKPMDDATSVILKKGQMDVAQFAVPSGRPVLSEVFVGPVTSNTNNQGNRQDSVLISWKATHPQLNPAPILHHDIYCSSDGGYKWSPCAVMLTASSANIDLSGFPGRKPIYFAVGSSDGYHESFLKITEPITLARILPPHPQIIVPLSQAGATATEGVGLNFIGRANDPQDGVVPDSQLTWVSDRDGAFLNGARGFVKSLSVGIHQVTLRAVNSFGKVGTSKPIKVTITPAS